MGFKFVPCAGDFYVWGTWLSFTYGALDWFLRVGHLIDFYVWDTWLIFTCEALDWFLRVGHLIDFYVWGTWLIFTCGTLDWFLRMGHLIDFYVWDTWLTFDWFCQYEISRLHIWEYYLLRTGQSCLYSWRRKLLVSTKHRYISLTLKIPLHFQIYAVTWVSK